MKQKEYFTDYKAGDYVRLITDKYPDGSLCVDSDKSLIIDSVFKVEGVALAAYDWCISGVYVVVGGTRLDASMVELCKVIPSIETRNAIQNIVKTPYSGTVVGSVADVDLTKELESFRDKLVLKLVSQVHTENMDLSVKNIYTLADKIIAYKLANPVVVLDGKYYPIPYKNGGVHRLTKEVD